LERTRFLIEKEKSGRRKTVSPSVYCCFFYFILLFFSFHFITWVVLLCVCRPSLLVGILASVFLSGGERFFLSNKKKKRILLFVYSFVYVSFLVGVCCLDFSSAFSGYAKWWFWWLGSFLRSPNLPNKTK